MYHKTDFDITAFGAKGDGETLDTAAIQNAVEACFEAGGGYVTIPPGIWLTGSIELKENVFLYLDTGAVLLASLNRTDYRKVYPEADTVVFGQADSPFNLDQYLIYARNTRNTGIIGSGIINARGLFFYDRDKTRCCMKYKMNGVEYTPREWRPGPTVCFLDCEDVEIREVTILDNPMFALALLHCKGGQIRNIRIKTDSKVINGDGIHLKSSRNILISGCLIEAEDDALCFYTDNWFFVRDRKESQDCTNIVVSDCICSSACSGIRFGYMGEGNLSNIVVSNIIIKQAKTALDFICNGGTSGFDTIDCQFPGTMIENIQISNLIAENCFEGIRMNLHPSASENAGIGNIHFCNISIGSRYGNFICGNGKKSIENITFANADFRTVGESKKKITEVADPLPIFSEDQVSGYIFVVRHAMNITFSNCHMIPADWQKEILYGPGTDADRV